MKKALRELSLESYAAGPKAEHKDFLAKVKEWYDATDDSGRGVLESSFSDAGRKMLTGIRDDRALIMRTIHKLCFQELVAADTGAYMRALLGTRQTAMQWKKEAYRLWCQYTHADLPREFDSLDIQNFSIPVYKLPWNDFVTLMSRDFERIHRSPDQCQKVMQEYMAEGRSGRGRPGPDTTARMRGILTLGAIGAGYAIGAAVGPWWGVAVAVGGATVDFYGTYILNRIKQKMKDIYRNRMAAAELDTSLAIVRKIAGGNSPDMTPEETVWALRRLDDAIARSRGKIPNTIRNIGKYLSNTILSEETPEELRWAALSVLLRASHEESKWAAVVLRDMLINSDIKPDKAAYIVSHIGSWGSYDNGFLGWAALHAAIRYYAGQKGFLLPFKKWYDLAKIEGRQALERSLIALGKKVLDSVRDDRAIILRTVRADLFKKLTETDTVGYLCTLCGTRIDAMRWKKEAYRLWRQETHVDLPARFDDMDIQDFSTTVYKLPWDDFVDLMTNDFERVHRSIDQCKDAMWDFMQKPQGGRGQAGPGTTFQMRGILTLGAIGLGCMVGGNWGVAIAMAGTIGDFYGDRIMADVEKLYRWISSCLEIQLGLPDRQYSLLMPVPGADGTIVMAMMGGETNGMLKGRTAGLKAAILGEGHTPQSQKQAFDELTDSARRESMEANDVLRQIAESDLPEATMEIKRKALDCLAQAAFADGEASARTVKDMAPYLTALIVSEETPDLLMQGAVNTLLNAGHRRPESANTLRDILINPLLSASRAAYIINAMGNWSHSPLIWLAMDGAMVGLAKEKAALSGGKGFLATVEEWYTLAGSQGRQMLEQSFLRLKQKILGVIRDDRAMILKTIDATSFQELVRTHPSAYVRALLGTRTDAMRWKKEAYRLWWRAANVNLHDGFDTMDVHDYDAAIYKFPWSDFIMLMANDFGRIHRSSDECLEVVKTFIQRMRGVMGRVIDLADIKRRATTGQSITFGHKGRYAVRDGCVYINGILQDGINVYFVDRLVDTDGRQIYGGHFVARDNKGLLNIIICREPLAVMQAGFQHELDACLWLQTTNDTFESPLVHRLAFVDSLAMLYKYDGDISKELFDLGIKVKESLSVWRDEPPVAVQLHAAINNLLNDPQKAGQREGFQDFLQRHGLGTPDLGLLADVRALGQGEAMVIATMDGDQPSTVMDWVLYLQFHYTELCDGLDIDDVTAIVTAVLGNKTDTLRDYQLTRVAGIQGVISRRTSGKALTLEREEARSIRTLSIAMDKRLRDLSGTGAIQSEEKFVFRESRRFMEIFSRYYLRSKDSTEQLKKLFSFFVLTAWTVYGRFIKLSESEKRPPSGPAQFVGEAQSSRAHFAQFLKNMFESPFYRDLFSKAAIEAGEEYSVSRIMDEFDNGVFDDEPLYGAIKSYRKILAAVSRARSCLLPLFVFLPNNQFPNVVEKALSLDEKNTVVPVDFSRFTMRKEFFGMDLPDRNGAMEWRPGLIERLINEAKANPDKRVYLVGNNINAASGDFRMALHSFLLERKCTLTRVGPPGPDGTRQRRDEEVALPDNLQIVLPLGEEAGIADPSFMDRGAGYHLAAPVTEEVKDYLEQEMGLPDRVAVFLSDLYRQTQANRFLHDTVRLQDIVQIGYYTAGNLSARKEALSGEAALDVCRREAYLHLVSKFSSSRDPEAMEEARRFTGRSYDFKISVGRVKNRIVVDFSGVAIPVDPKSLFGKFLEKKFAEKADNRPLDFKAALEEFEKYEYFVTPTEERMFCLLARVYALSPSKTTFLLGPSGEGKTTIARVFLDIIGAKTFEMTINSKSDISVLRGTLNLTRKGVELSTPPYWKMQGEEKFGAVYNEINAREALLWWLWPHITGRSYRLGTEYPALEETIPADRVDFGKTRINILSGNPDREYGDIPEYLLANLPASYCLDSSEDDSADIAGRMFTEAARQAGSGLNGEITECAQKAAAIYNGLRRAIRAGQFLSQREVTRRELKRFAAVFFDQAGRGKSVAEAYGFAVNMVFITMWDNLTDVQHARDIIADFGADVSPPAYEEIIEFLKRYPLKAPLLLLTNGTVSINDVKTAIVPEHTVLSDRLNGQGLPQGTAAVLHEIPLSGFHTNQNLVGGLSVSHKDDEPGNELGILAWTILQAHLYAEVRHIAWMPGYLRLNARIAPYFNEFFQTGKLDVAGILDSGLAAKIIAEVKRHNGAYQKVRERYAAYADKAFPDTERADQDLPGDIDELTGVQAMSLARFLIGQTPDNLDFIASGTAGEKIDLHAADIDRFFTVNLAGDYTEQWMGGFIDAAISGDGFTGSERAAIRYAVRTAYRAYAEEKKAGLYLHNRLQRADIEVFLNEIRRKKAEGTLDPALIKLLAYHTLGMGLVEKEPDEGESVGSRDFRKEFVETLGFDIDRVRYDRAFFAENGEVYFTINAEVGGTRYCLARQKTAYTAFTEKEFGYYEFKQNGNDIVKRLQAPIQALLRQEASELIYYRYSTPVSLEGNPGGGKTSSLADLANALGVDEYEEGMYNGIQLTTLLGGLDIRGTKITLSVFDKDIAGRSILPFLRLYKEGGIYVLDEGAISRSAENILRWVIHVSKQEYLDLGVFHPGLQGQRIKRDPNFRVFITQNHHFKTESRLHPAYEIDCRAGKIRVDNRLSHDDAVTLIRYYLEGQSLDDGIVANLADLHNHLCQFHPARRMVSPRDLIDLVLLIKKSRSGAQDMSLLYKGLWINYAAGSTDGSDRKAVEELIRRFFPQYETPVMDTPVRAGSGSNVDYADIAHLEGSPTYKSSVGALDYIVSSMDRPALIVQEPGANAVDLIKLFSYTTMRRMEVIDGHPFMTAKYLLDGESVEFEKEFTPDGKRRSNDNFVRTYGFFGRHMIEESRLPQALSGKHDELILTINNIEAIPKSQLVKLNRLLTNRYEYMRNPEGRLVKYVLPPWVHIVNVTSSIDKITSPFANRHRKIGLPALHDTGELADVIRKLYPSLTDIEIGFLKEITDLVSDAGRSNGFELGYNFTPNDIFELAKRVQLYKQRDAAWPLRGLSGTPTHPLASGVSAGKSFEIDPLWYAVKATRYLFRTALSPEDRKTFDRLMLTGAFKAVLPGATIHALAAYYRRLLEGFSREERVVTTTHEVEVPETGTCENGIVVKKENDTVTVITPAHFYPVETSRLAGGETVRLSDGLGVRMEGQRIILSLALVDTIGGVPLRRSPENDKYALPIEELGMEEYLYPAKPLVRAVTSVLEAFTPVNAATGKFMAPRLELIGGETGTGKTSLIKMLSRIQGVPLVRLNPYRRMPVSKITTSLSLGKTIEMNVSEFLAACGTINGRRVTDTFPTSNRVYLLVDEANITYEAWFILDAIARGERCFTIEAGTGDPVRVELDKEVMIYLTYNHPEHYGGTGIGGNRYPFPAPVSGRSVKVYMPEPLMEYTDDEMNSILEAIYERGEQDQKRKEALEGVTIPSFPRGFMPVEVRPADVTALPEQPAVDLARWAEEIAALAVLESAQDEADKKADEEKEKRQLEELRKRYVFQRADFEARLTECESLVKRSQNGGERYYVFAKALLNSYFTGLAWKEIDEKLYERVKRLAGQVDVALEGILERARDLFARETLSESDLRSLMREMDASAISYGVYLEAMNVTVADNGTCFLFVEPCPLKGIATPDIATLGLEQLVGRDFKEMLFGAHVPDVFFLARPPVDGTLGYFDGRDLVAAHQGDAWKELECAYHEFGHLVSDRIKKSVQQGAGNEAMQAIARSLGKNVELYSMLFPLLYLEDHMRYINIVFMGYIRDVQSGNKPKDWAYAQAAKAILNAFAVKWGLTAVDDYEDDRIDLIKAELARRSDREISEIALEFLHNAGYYFANIPNGYYYGAEGSVTVGGVSYRIRLSEGMAQRPRMKIERASGKKETVKLPETPKGSKFIKDDVSVPEIMGMLSDEKDLPPASARFMDQFKKVYAQDRGDDSPEELFVREGGTSINAEGYATKNVDILFNAPVDEVEEKGLALNVFIWADISGTVTSDDNLVDAINEMIRHFAANLAALSGANPDLNLALGAASTGGQVVMSFDEWIKARTPDARKRLIKKKLALLWHSGDGGGINTEPVLNEIMKTRFPAPAGKNVKNLILVLTDGEECQEQGDGLKEKIVSFRRGEYRPGAGDIQPLAGQVKKPDIVFLGVNLGNGGNRFPENYPCYVHLTGSVTAETYLNALLGIALLQAKGRLNGDLSKNVGIAGQGEDAEGATASRKATVIRSMRHMGDSSRTYPGTTLYMRG
ncbi:MAG: hypothetical protein PHS37_03880, partial [Candidatus Omnitrophica bacterium]|nr:hypothetical protein [Candidatus Omnitrophota bacterium]